MEPHKEEASPARNGDASVDTPDCQAKKYEQRNAKDVCQQDDTVIALAHSLTDPLDYKRAVIAKDAAELSTLFRMMDEAVCLRNDYVAIGLSNGCIAKVRAALPAMKALAEEVKR